MKTLIPILATCFCMALLSGCAPVSSHDGGDPGPSASVGPRPAVVLSVMVGHEDLDDGALASGNPLNEWIRSRVGEQLGFDVDFIPVWTRESDIRLNVLLASGTAPDLCFTFDQQVMDNIVARGQAMDATSLLDEQGKSVTASVGQELMEYGTYDGRQFAIPSRRVFFGKYTTYVRKDWLDALYLDIPDTYEEFIGFLRAVKRENPGGGGVATIPLALSTDEKTYENMILPFIDRSKDYVPYAYDTFVAPGAREGLAILNGLYQEGLVNRDFAIDFNNDRLNRSIASGHVAAVTLRTGEIYRPGLMEPLKTAQPDAEYVPCDPFRTSSSAPSVKKSHSPVYHYLFIPVGSVRSREAVRYLNWLGDPDIQVMIQDRLDGEPMMDRLAYALVSHGVERGSVDDDILEIARSNPPYFREIQQSCRMSLNGALPHPSFRRYAKYTMQYREVLQVKREELFVRCLMAPEDLFDVTYDVLLAEYMEMGGAKIIDETIAAFRFATMDFAGNGND